MNLPKIDPVAYDKWKLKEPNEEANDDAFVDWNGTVITDGNYWFIDGDFVAEDELVDYAEYYYNLVEFQNGDF